MKSNITNYQFLKGKKVLFLSWAFYEYPNKIITTLKGYGADVTYLCSAPTTDFMSMKFFKKSKYFKEKYYSSLLDRVDGMQFDFLFLINAATFSEEFIKEICEKQAKAKKVLYLWDSLKVFPQALAVSDYFDEVFTFDSVDAQQNQKFKFLPLFWCDDLYNGKQELGKYDFSFIGFGHSERYVFLKEIENQAKAWNYHCYFKLYLPSFLHYLRGKYIKKNFANAKKTDFVYKTIPQEELKKVTLSSKIVVDLELETQTGVTMRTIETHGMRKKMITTNKNIMNYDFYHPDNILVVDRKKPIVPQTFVETPYHILEEELYSKYSLKHWIKVIFGGTQ